MTPGRNDPCPCGSGKKYKKCCLDKPAAIPVTKPAGPVERRFFSPATSYYTQGALAQALTPGGTVHIHPYVLVKLRDDPRFFQAARPEDAARLVQAWRPSKLAGMSLEEIETRLAL